MQLKNVIKAGKSRCDDHYRIHKYHMKYFRELIKRVKKKEYEYEDQKIITCTGLVNLSRLKNIRVSKSDTRLYWIMFHKIDAIYRDMKHQ